MKITDKTTIKELQDYIRQFVTDRGFENESVEQKFVSLVEEVGELAKAIRPAIGIKFAADTSRTEIEEEFADVLLLLLSLANKLDVDMATAIENKEVKNRKRSWR